MLKVEGLWKTYTVDGGEIPAVRGVDFTVETGEFFTLLGPSGCGKSTTLRCIAGLEVPNSAEITLGEIDLFSSRQRRSVPIHKRNIGMVFQSYAIWPHMSVYDNVDFPLKVKSVPDRRDKVMRALELVGLHHLEDRSATNLSGGQQQRVAQWCLDLERNLTDSNPVIHQLARERFRDDCSLEHVDVGRRQILLGPGHRNMLGPNHQKALARRGTVMRFGGDLSDRRLYRRVRAVGRDDFTKEKVALADELGSEKFSGLKIDILRLADLDDVTVVHHRHPVRQDHGFFLVMGDIDAGDAELLLQLAQLEAHLESKLAVQIA